MIERQLGAIIAIAVGGLLTNFASAGSDSDTTREDMSLTYLHLLPDESVKSLFDWCHAHQGEPVSTNPVIEVPNYVSCGEVDLEHLARGFGELADDLEERLKEGDLKGFTCENPPKAQDKEMTDAICVK